MVEVNSFAFSIDLAVLAASRNLFALDKWLQNRIAAAGEVFIAACLDFLSERITNDPRQNGLPSKELPVETIAVFLQVLQGRYGPQLTFDSHSVLWINLNRN